MSGTVEHIHIAAKPGAPAYEIQSVRAVAGGGLDGDRNSRREGEKRDAESCDLTLIEAEAIEAAAREHDIHLVPGESRRNVTTRGIRLNDLVGKEFRIGEVRARGVELCEPCSHLVKVTGKQLIKALVHRGGLRADVLTTGKIAVGDAIEPLA